MSAKFSVTLRKLREERGLSQKQLGKQMFVNHSTIARWENGTRLPDAAMIYRISKCFGVEADALFEAVAESEASPNVIPVDDDTIILKGSIQIMEEVMPDASVVGFTNPKEVLDFAGKNRIALALLDIEMGRVSGLDLCRSLLEINPCTNVIYLTAYPDYSLDAWDTDACGFMVKPLTPEGVRKQLKKLRYPFSVGGAEA